MIITTIILFVILIISLITDIKERKILNIVTFPSILLGLIFNTYAFGWEGFFLSFLGILTGFGLLFIPYALGGIAAGDVKLLMAIGALKGTSFVLGSFIYTAIFGGIIALIILIINKDLLNAIKRIFISAQLKTLNSLSKNELHRAFPYGVAIVAGTLFYSGVMLFD